jgi:hypothetical protein
MRRHFLHSLVDPGFSARLGRGTAIASSATAASTVAHQVRKSLAAKIANTPGASKKGGKTTTGGSGRGSKEGQRKSGKKS